MKQTLIDTQKFTPQNLILEGVRSNQNPIVEGILATVDKPNGNGRYYSRDIWEREINKYIDGPIKERRSTGELDHSSSEVVLLQNASHLITEIWWGGDNIMGKVEILPTPMGNILKTLLENQVTLGISSRGLGSVQQMGEILEVQDDFELVTFDFVSTPSNSNSWFKMSLNENKNVLNNQSNYIRVNQILNNIIYNL